MMHMEHRLAQTQSQQLVITLKMQQGLHILQLSGLELEQYVQQELEQNPFLEQVQKKPEERDISVVTSDKSGKTEDINEYEEGFDLDSYMDSWRIRHREGQDLSFNPEQSEKLRYYEDSITQGESLRSRLLQQLRLADLNALESIIGERIVIGEIDERGYFVGNEDEIATDLCVTKNQVVEVLNKIQTFEPTGIGARNIEECLLFQIAVEFPNEPELCILVKEHFEALKLRQIPKIAKAMNVSLARVEELKGLLATLDPWPGRQFSQDAPQYIQPEVVVEKVDGEYVVRLVNEQLPEVEINHDYHQMVKNNNLSKDEKSYVREKLEAARWLKRNLTQRQQTIVRVAEAIVNIQREFLDKGVEHIKPLKLQDIADLIGMHESTVARTTKGKYIQTPQGLFELKYFFSPGLRSDEGEDQSSKSIQALVKKIVDEENPKKPLSDQKISDLIKKQGINVARRTVSKYREGLGIPSTTLRRQYSKK